MSDYSRLEQLRFELNALRKRGLYQSVDHLMEELVQRAYQIHYKMTKNAALAEDLAQESVLKAWQSLDTLKDSRSFYSWFSRLTRNVGYDAYRKREYRADQRYDAPEFDQNYSNGVLNASRTDDDFLDIARSTSFQNAYAQLSQNDRNVLDQHYFLDKSVGDMSHETQVKENSIKVQLFRARKKLLAAYQNQLPASHAPTYQRKQELLSTVLFPAFETVYGQLMTNLKMVSLKQVIDVVEQHPSLRKRYGANLYSGVWKDLKELGIQIGHQREMRRQKLVDRIILPYFGISDPSGNKQLPPEISIGDVADTVATDPELRGEYPNGLYMSVFFEIHALGIPIKDKGERISTVLRKKIASDPSYLDALQQRMDSMTKKRIKMYETNPELAQKSYRSSAATRHMKFQTDERFHAQVIASLDAARSARWKGFKNDPTYRQSETFEKMLTGLEKGNQKRMQRTQDRRTFLRDVIDTHFGGAAFATPQKLRRILVAEFEIIGKHFPKGVSCGTLKKDLAALRKLEKK